MTFEGQVKALTRHGINSNVSPLLKMSFETTGAFLTQAALFNEWDDLQSPSASITAGQPIGIGSNAFNVVESVDLDEM